MKFIIFFIILIILYFYYINNLNNVNIEHFYTLFKPFYYPKINKKYLNIIDEYNSSINNSCIENKYNSDKIIFGSYYQSEFKSNEIDLLTMFLSKLFLANTVITDINITKYELSSQLLLDINKNKIDLGIIPSPILYDGIVGDGLIYKDYNFKNIEFISNTNNTYIFILTNIINKYSSIYDLKGQKIYAGIKHSLSWKCAIDIFNNINFKENIDYEFVDVKFNEAIKLLNENKIGSILLTDIFPSKLLYNIINNDFNNNFFILPLDNINESIFLNRYFYYEKTYIDLNKVSNHYLPKKVENKSYTIFRPNLLTYKFCNMLVNNNKLNSIIGYNIVKTLHDNINLLNKQKIYTYNKLSNLYMTFTYIPIPLNKGVKKYFEEKGFISYNKSNNCIYYLGNIECNKNNLNKLDTDLLLF